MRFALFLLVAGCTTQPAIGPGDDSGPGGDTIAPDGNYDITTSFDISVEALVPDPSTLTATLTAYMNEPGGTMLAMDVPALATLRAELPDAVYRNLPMWIDQSVGALSRLAVLTLQTGVALSFDRFDVASELSFSQGVVKHRLLSINFPAFAARFILGSEPGEALVARTTSTTFGAGLTIGDHTLAIGVGAYAWDTSDAALAQAGGIRGSLGEATQCSIVALEIVSSCGIACAVHVDDLNALCEQALDEITARGRVEASQLRFATLDLTSGQVGMADPDDDHIADALFEGAWTAEVDAGNGAVALAPTFAGAKRAASNPNRAGIAAR